MATPKPLLLMSEVVQLSPQVSPSPPKWATVSTVGHLAPADLSTVDLIVPPLTILIRESLTSPVLTVDSLRSIDAWMPTIVSRRERCSRSWSPSGSGRWRWCLSPLRRSSRSCRPISHCRRCSRSACPCRRRRRRCPALGAPNRYQRECSRSTRRYLPAPANSWLPVVRPVYSFGLAQAVVPAPASSFALEMSRFRRWHRS